MEKKLKKLINDKAAGVVADIELESKNRSESISHIRQCLSQDFPKLQNLIEKEGTNA